MPQGNNKQIDKSTIPPAVRRAAEEAERLLQANINGEAPPAPEGEQPPPAEPAREPEARPQPTHPTPPREAAPEPARQEKPGDEDPNGETWRKRFESEQGRTNKLRNDVAHLSTQVDNLTRLLGTVQAAPPAEPEMRFERKVTPEMEQEWGPDFFKAVEARAAELIAPLEEKLNRQLAQVGGQVETVTKSLGANARQDMLRDLDNNDKIKDWRIINDDPEFVTWLKYPDPMSGRVRHDMLLEAWNANDASRVAATFATFLKEGSTTAPRPGSQPEPAAQPPKPSLEQFVAPGRVRSAPTPQGQSGDDEIITASDITRFYADRAAGRFNTPDLKAKADAYEAQIFKAQREGRIKT